MYQKMISYVYEYIDGKKGKNIGFVKLAVQNQVYKIRIQVTEPALNGRELAVYGFVREKGILHSAHIGSITVVNGVAAGMFSGNCGELWERYRFMDMDGMLLCWKDGIRNSIAEKKIPIFCATQWDDEPIAFHDFDVYVELKKQTLEQVEFRKTFEDLQAKEIKKQKIEKEEKKVLHAAGVEVKPSFSYEKIVEEKEKEETKLEEKACVKVAENMADMHGSVCFVEAEEKQGKTLEQEQFLVIDEKSRDDIVKDTFHKQEEAVCVDETKAYSRNCRKEDREYLLGEEDGTKELVERIKKHEKEEEASIEVCGEVANQEEKTKMANRKEEKEDIWDLFEKRRIQMKEQYEKLVRVQEKNEMENLWEPGEEFLNAFPVLNPFFQEDVLASVRMEPKDIGGLPMEHWYLANNSFLLHGYYCYRHLLFLKLRNRQEYQYAIAVPGNDTYREQFMANMFGFEQFKPVKKNESFGYWWKRIV